MKNYLYRARLIHVLVQVVLIGSVHAVARAQNGGDEPTDFEKRLYEIYKQSEPVPQAKWEELVGGRRTEVYTVAPGDTLWDISQTLFGDGLFWSKLWAENSALENPHQINPGQQIRLMSGSEANAPAITVGDKGGNDESGERSDGITTRVLTEKDMVEGADISSTGHDSSVGTVERGPVYREEALKKLTPEELASGANIEVDELVPTPDIPAAGHKRSVLKKLPRSFVSAVQPKSGEYDITGLDAHLNRALTVSATVVPNSYLAEGEPAHIGTVDEIEAQEKVASAGQNVFIKLASKASIGDRFSVIYPKGKIKVGATQSFGPVVEIGGRVEVIGTVNEDKNVYKAMVVLGISPIRIGSLVTQEPLPRTNYSRRGTRTTIVATVIGGEFDEERSMLGEGSVVYLNDGHKAGLNTGDILPIQARRGQRWDSTKYPDYNEAIGLIKLVKVEESVATGVILEAHEEIMIGDRTGGKLAAKPAYREEKVEDEPKL